jgi:hypothetical protein
MNILEELKKDWKTNKIKFVINVIIVCFILLASEYVGDLLANTKIADDILQILITALAGTLFFGIHAWFKKK